MTEPAVEKTFRDKAIWLQLEYEQIHEYGRSVYETIFRLAQATFIINPALVAGYYYVFFDQHAHALKIQNSSATSSIDIGLVGAAFALLGFVYNCGALGVYWSSHTFLETLLIRMRVIDNEVGAKTHRLVQVTAPLSYLRYWGRRSYLLRATADGLTRFFLLSILTLWLALFVYTIVRLNYIMPASITVAIWFALLIIFFKIRDRTTKNQFWLPSESDLSEPNGDGPPSP